METLIIIALLLVIGLLLHDKSVAGKNRRHKKAHKKNSAKLPDIMGQPKPLRSLLTPKPAAGSQHPKGKTEKNNFDSEIKEDPLMQIQSEELDDVFKYDADLKQEQQEWNSYGISAGEGGFTQGVTLEELSFMEMLLQKNTLEPSEKITAVTLVHKIQGTELFSLLENSIESASRKITALLDESLAYEKEAGLGTMKQDDLNDFNIGDFV